MKKIIGIYLLLQAAMKGVCFFLSLSSDESFLPVIVLVTCAVLMAGAVLSLIHIFSGGSVRNNPPAAGRRLRQRRRSRQADGAAGQYPDQPVSGNPDFSAGDAFDVHCYFRSSRYGNESGGGAWCAGGISLAAGPAGSGRSVLVGERNGGGWHLGRRWRYADPVSYTHLDVYKRQ